MMIRRRSRGNCVCIDFFMQQVVTKKIFKRQLFRGVSAVLPLVTGLLWGIFWVHCVAGMEDFYTGIAMVALAFAGGALFRRLPGILAGKLACWYIAGFAFINFDVLLPAAFFFGVCRRRNAVRSNGGRFFAGIIAGAFVGYCCEWALPALIINGMLYFLFYGHKRKNKRLFGRITAALFNVVIIAMVLLLVQKPDILRATSKTVAEYSMTPVTRLCSVGLSDSAEPEILMIAKRCPQLQMPFEFAVFENIKLLPPGKLIPQKYDIIVVEDVSAAIMSVPQNLTRALKRGGVLAVPQHLSRKFPELKWHTLPGSSEAVFVAAIPDSTKALVVNGDVIEKNLLKMLEKSDAPENILLPGALSGVLIDFKSEILVPDKIVTLPNSRYWYWGVFALLILVELLLGNSKIRDLYCSGVGAMIFALICGVLFGGNEISTVIDGDWLLVILAVGAFFIELPFKLNVLRVFSLLSMLMLWVWWWCPNFYSAVLAMFFAAASFSGSKHYFANKQIKCEIREAFIAACFAGGFMLCGYIHDMILSTLAAICAVKVWMQFRS